MDIDSRSDNARKLINWRYGLCPIDSDPLSFGPFQQLVSMWRHKCEPGANLPRRSDFDLPDFRGWWGKVAIAKFEHNPFDVRFVLWGTQLTEWWGVDYTNKSLGSQSSNPELWKQVEGKYFEEMIANPFIGLVEGKLDQYGRQHINVLGVDLPLTDGQSISHVLMVHTKNDADEALETAIPGAPISRYF